MSEKITITGEKTTRIPDGIQVINVDTLDWKFEIEELFIPDSVEKVDTAALDGCYNLRKLTIPAKFMIPYTGYEAYKIPSGIETSAKMFAFWGTSTPNLEELVIYGDETELDLSSFKIEKFRRLKVIRFENELTSLSLPKLPSGPCPRVYINNYVEQVELKTPNWSTENIRFKAPRLNRSALDGKAIELTLAPREFIYNDNRWNCPVILKVSSVTYVMPVEISCYETEKHMGSKLVLLGDKLNEQAKDCLNHEFTPYIIVWEDIYKVFNKLNKKGWQETI